MSTEKKYSSCEPRPLPVKKYRNQNRHYSYKGDFRWRGVKTDEYKYEGSDWSSITRQVLIGAHSETTDFHLRYFEIQPGGYSSFETHRHEHVVVGIRGTGKVRLNRRTVDLKFLDVLYISPGTAHRLYNPYETAFGFFCIVNAKRDRPVPVSG